MYEKWKKAVIHLECATDSEHFYDRIKRIDQLRVKLDQGEITQVLVWGQVLLLAS